MVKKFLAIILLSTTLFSSSILIAFAQSESERLVDLQKQIADLEGKVNQTRSNIKTLDGQINAFDNQIKLTQLKITDTQKKISVLEQDIDVLSRKIIRVEDNLSLLQQTLLQRIRATYALGETSPLELYLSSKGFSDILTAERYLEILQKNDLKLLSQMQNTKQNYGDQKTTLEERQNQLEAAKAELNKQNSLLAQQKADKQKLLEATRNDEKRYQQLIALSRAELRAIESAIANSFNLRNGVKVNKGDIIALIGNSGGPVCTTGPHLHFEVRANGSLRDPASYLKPTSLVYDDDQVVRINGSGSWDWPIQNPEITQEFGMSYWARTGFYGGGPHTGIDMVSRSSSAIRAVADGTLYKASTKCGSAVMRYAVLDHGNGIRSYYLHIQ